MNRAYVRVSTIEQNEARQIKELEQHNIDVWYQEKISGKNTDRPEFKKMMDESESGDVIYIHDFSRLARSTKDLLDIVETLNNRGIHLVSNKENIDTSTATGKLMLTMIGAINEFERVNMLERQREGIEIAKSSGKYNGRFKDISIDDLKSGYEAYKNGHMTKTLLAKKLGITRSTLDRKLREESLI